MVGWGWFPLLALAVVACTATTVDPPTTSVRTEEHALSVEEILQRMNERYASARTYRDEGTFRHRLDEDRESARGRTAWVAPDQMRFEIVEEKVSLRDRIVVTSRAGATRTLFLGEIRNERSLDDALGASQGVSHGTTGLAPRWLVEHGCHFAARYALDGQEACGSSTCFKLVGELRGLDVTLDVDTKTFALRRYRSRGRLMRDAATAREALERLPPAARVRQSDDAWIQMFLRPIDIESDLELEPVFDGPVPAQALEQLPPPDASAIEAPR